MSVAEADSAAAGPGAAEAAEKRAASDSQKSLFMMMKWRSFPLSLLAQTTLFVDPKAAIESF